MWRTALFGGGSALLGELDNEGGYDLARLWIVVAESSRAKVYSAQNWLTPISEIEDMVHPEGRMHEGDLVSDAPGSDGGTMGQGRRILDDKTTARAQENAEFANAIAHRLAQGQNERAFDELVLVAPPAFLGLLRNKLSKTLAESVALEIDKNLVKQPAAVIAEHVWSAR